MRIYNTLYRGRDITIDVTVSTQSSLKDKDKGDKPLIERRTTKRTGEYYLSYNPQVGIKVGSTTLDKNLPVALLPFNKIHLLQGLLEKSYNSLNTKGLYTKNNGVLYLDSKVAAGLATRLSCAVNSIVLVPAITLMTRDKNAETREEIQGVSVQVENKEIGRMTHYEMRDAIDILNRLDAPVYAVLMGIMDKIDEMDCKIDDIMNVQLETRDIVSEIKQELNRTSPYVPVQYDPQPQIQTKTPESVKDSMMDFNWHQQYNH